MIEANLIGAASAIVLGLAIYALWSRSHRCALAAEVEQLSTVVENLPGVAYRGINDPRFPLQFVSDGCQQLSGYARGDFESQRIGWGELVSNEDRDRRWHAIQAALNAGRVFELEYRITTRENEERWVWERGKGVVGPRAEQKILEGFISDITDRKKVDRQLFEARGFSDAIVDIAAEAVITINANGCIETFNRSAQQMFNYSAEEIRGKNISLLMPEPFRSEHDAYIERYLATNEAKIIGTGREVLAKKKNRSVFPIHLSVSEIHLHEERKFVALIRDISLQRAAESEARESREQLAHVDRLNMLGEMASGIAHEINQPLTAISLFSQAGKRLLDAGNPERLPEIFDKLSRHAERAGAIIERMQSMARRGESARERSDCNKLVVDVTKLAEAEARIRDVVIDTKLVNDLPAIDVDVVQIQQVALNLLRNGMEAMHSIDCRDGNVIRVHTDRRMNGDIEISVIDSGAGVSEAIADTIFTPFSTTKDSGMGMGLSLSRSIVSAHGGEIGYRNNENGGATFFFFLPAAN